MATIDSKAVEALVDSYCSWNDGDANAGNRA